MKKYDAILLLGYGLDENDQATQELRLRVKAAAKAFGVTRNQFYGMLIEK